MTRYPCIIFGERSAARTTWRAMAALMCLSIVMLLSGCVAAQSNTTVLRTTPSPTSDPVLQRYVVGVHTYYPPFSDAILYEDEHCRTVKPTPWTACQSASASVLTAGQTLLAQLPSSPPAAPWPTLDSALKQAVHAALSAYTARAPAIASHNSTAFEDDNVAIIQAVSQQCDLVSQFNQVAPSGNHIEAPHGVCA